MPRRIVMHLHVVAQIPTETPSCILRVVRVDMAGAVAQQRLFHMMNLVAPGNPAPQVHILAANEARIEAADLGQHALTKDRHRGNRPPIVVTDGFCERPPIRDTRFVEELASIGIEQDVVAGDHICAGAPSLGKLPLKLVWKPDIVVVQERYPFASRPLDTEIAGYSNVSLVKGEIPALVNGRGRLTFFAHIAVLPVGNDDDFVIREGLCPDAGEGFGEPIGSVVCWNDD
jgi:hypothetical protein